MATRDALVLDASVTLSWCFEDEVHAYSDAVLEYLESGEALVPIIWPLEVGNALLVAERKGRLSKANTTRFLALLGQLPIVVERESPERMLRGIIALARAHSLSTYDASYLDLAMRNGLPLATQDSRLLHAAKQCGVRTFPG